jgi:hypothetical protein
MYPHAMISFVLTVIFSPPREMTSVNEIRSVLLTDERRDNKPSDEIVEDKTNDAAMIGLESRRINSTAMTYAQGT